MEEGAVKPGDPAGLRRWAIRRPLGGAPGFRARAGAWAACVASCVLFFLWLPSPIDAEGWVAGPLTLPGEPLNRVRIEAPRLQLRGVTGGESIAFDAAGRLYTGGEDGVIYRADPDGPSPSLHAFAQCGGRPLGLAFDGRGRLLIANHPLGLQRVEPDGTITPLLTEVDGERLAFPNAIAVAADGVIYVTESSARFTSPAGFPPPWGAYDMLEARPHGRLIAFDQESGAASVLREGLHFPNGVALSRDGGTLYVAETFRCRVLAIDRVSGEARPLVEGLWGFPDNLSVDERGRLWIAMGVLRSGASDWVSARPWLKNQIAKLPRPLWHHVAPAASVAVVDPADPRRWWLAQGGHGFADVLTGAYPRDGTIYLSTLQGDGIFGVERREPLR